MSIYEDFIPLSETDVESNMKKYIQKIFTGIINKIEFVIESGSSNVKTVCQRDVVEERLFYQN